MRLCLHTKVSKSLVIDCNASCHKRQLAFTFYQKLGWCIAYTKIISIIIIPNNINNLLLSF